MQANYENSDISIISEGTTWKTWILSKGTTWSYWVRPRRPVRQLQQLAGGSHPIRPEKVVFFTFVSVVFIFASLVFLCLLFSIFVSVIFYVCVLYLPFPIFASVIYYICVLYLSFSIFAALSRRCYHPTTTIIVHITSSSWPRISKYWAFSDVRSQKKLANGDFVAQSFCSRNK